MKRRRFVQAMMSAPAAALAGQQQQVAPPQQGPAQPAPGIPLNPTQPIQPPGRAAAVDLVKLDPSFPDSVAEMMPHYFSQAEFATLRKVSEVLMPAFNGKPGALEANAADFLDFLIGQSPADRQEIYRSGLDALGTQAKKRFNKEFADLDAQQIDALFAPLHQPWTFETPSDPIARFLRMAKQDVRTATVNSRVYATTSTGGAGARRGAVASGLYWYPLD